MYALVDCNNFYASCERVFRPDLVGKPICVLSNNDGCVIARSNEAKALGIPMGAPAFKFEKEFEQKGIQVFSANFSLYGDMSKRVMNVLSDFSPELEVYSIDEIFLDLNGFTLYDLVDYGQQMRSKVQRYTGIPTSVGITPTKALSKLANRIAKKYPQLESVYYMDSEQKRIKALKWLSVGDIWGVGRQYQKHLLSMGVKTAFDFVELHDETVRKLMGVVGVRLKHDLEGKPTLSLDDVKVKKNIATTRSFDRNYTELADLEERVTSFAVSCAEKLRRQQSECSSLSVFVLTNRFRNDLPQYDRNINIKLPFTTSSSIEIARYAVFGLRSIFKAGYSYKKAGVILNDFTPSNQKQLSIFAQSDKRHVELMRAVDTINTNFGGQKIKLASQDLKRLWKMKQERLSPKYSTRLSDIITVNCM
jgi:DNA polymerase V